MRSKPGNLYLLAIRAFKRLHGYPSRIGEFGHDRYLCGWQQGYLAGLRKAKRTSTSANSEPSND